VKAKGYFTIHLVACMRYTLLNPVSFVVCSLSLSSMGWLNLILLIPIYALVPAMLYTNKAKGHVYTRLQAIRKIVSKNSWNPVPSSWFEQKRSPGLQSCVTGTEASNSSRWRTQAPLFHQNANNTALISV
jgi:hypothetical protein